LRGACRGAARAVGGKVLLGQHFLAPASAGRGAGRAVGDKVLLGQRFVEPPWIHRRL
jgi:hypothetical protein